MNFIKKIKNIVKCIMRNIQKDIKSTPTLNNIFDEIINDWKVLQVWILCDTYIQWVPLYDMIKQEIIIYGLHIDKWFISAYYPKAYPGVNNWMSYFWLSILFNSIRWILNSTIEWLKNKEYKKYVENKLWKKEFKNFSSLIRLWRNILSHSIDANYKISEENISKQYEYQKNHNLLNFTFNIDYKTFWLKEQTIFVKETNTSININFEEMVWKFFLEVIKIEELIKLTMLCWYLIQAKHDEDILKLKKTYK